MTEVPSALSTTTSQPGGRARPARRARYNIPAQNARIIPPAQRGEMIWRLVPDDETLRVWGRKHHFKVRNDRPVPKKVREHFARWNAWSVRIVSVQPPGAQHASAYFKIMLGRYEIKKTTKWWQVENTIGEDLFPLLRRVITL